ncbi:MAG: iron-containing alcohol dehydrogenase [Propionibacteriaceae bacterium]|nr:iron-containing alcohol dehydrogenase [Propionibacteriaceae bacterium]
MKALILNSGLGNRMGEFTTTHHKSMARLANGETIFHRQLRILSENEIREFVVTTGPFEDQLRGETQGHEFAASTFDFVPNPVYDKTNYIYSMYLARELLQGDVVILHGDLVFDTNFVRDILADPRPDLGSFNMDLPQPDKDFKVQPADGRINRVSVSIFGDDCFAFQPFYKLSDRALQVWMGEIGAFIEAGNDKVYAENALNEVSAAADIGLFSYAGYFLSEVDTLDDLAQTRPAISRFDFREQPLFVGSHAMEDVRQFLTTRSVTRPMLVCGTSFDTLPIASVIQEWGYPLVRFSGYSPNPKSDEAAAGLKLFDAQGCDGLISVGGGSAMDTAKAIKAFRSLASTDRFWEEEISYQPIPHVAIPTTAGTGAESTYFAVIYCDGVKYSVTHESLLPDAAVLIPDLLAGLPDYQRKATLLDALCQCIESTWAPTADLESTHVAAEGIRLILAQTSAYLGGDRLAARDIQKAANLSGKAIDVTRTNAPHAMSYRLSSLYGIAHGHAVALTVAQVWTFFLAHQAEASNPAQLGSALSLLASLFGVSDNEDAVAAFRDFKDQLGLHVPTLRSDDDLNDLVDSVNLQRLNNSPVPLDRAGVASLYAQSLEDARQS